MSRSASEYASANPREYDSWPCDSFFLLPDSVLAMDAGAFRADLHTIDPALSASLPEWPQHVESALTTKKPASKNRFGNASFTLLNNHEGLTVRSVGKGTILISSGKNISSEDSEATSSSNGPSTLNNLHRSPPQKDNASGLSYKDREERVRQLRERQQNERQHKLEELKEQAAAAQRFREQQEAARRQRLDDMRSKDLERRTQVEERKRIIQQAEQERREAVSRKGAEREQRLDHKRRQERSNAVFAFGSSTPRMLDPKETNYWASRRTTSTTNVNMTDSSSSIRRSSECQDSDLSRKRATSAHSLNRKHEDVQMSTSMHQVFNWKTSEQNEIVKSRDSSQETREGAARPRPRFSVWEFGDNFAAEGRSAPQFATAPTTPTSVLTGAGCTFAQGGEDPVARLGGAARRRTDLHPATPSFRESPRHRSPGVRSGTVTPSSRPTSALSHASGGSQVVLRNKPKKPRPLSIAGSTPSAVEKTRNSRSIERKASTSSVTSKLSRAKSASSSERSVPTTPSKSSSRGTTPRRTPAQVKAESAARKSSDRIKNIAKTKPTPTRPLEVKTPEKKKSERVKSETTESVNITADVSLVEVESSGPKNTEPVAGEIKSEIPVEVSICEIKSEIPVEVSICEIKSEIPVEVGICEIKSEIPVEVNICEIKDNASPNVSPPEIVVENIESYEEKKEDVPQEETEVLKKEEQNQENNKELKKDDTPELVNPSVKENLPQENIEETPPTKNEDVKEGPEESSSTPHKDKPVSGYATEEEYKAALAEKRRQAREAKEREQEALRQKQLEEEERERKEEEDYLRLIEDQKKVEEERLAKAIEEAEKQRQQEKIKAEEEEKQRIEAEKIEEQKRIEAEEKMRKEEEERQMRKSRVAAIMSRTRGRGATPSKSDSRTDEDKRDNLMTESFISTLSSSMTDSMIADAIASKEGGSTNGNSSSNGDLLNVSNDGAANLDLLNGVNQNGVDYQPPSEKPDNVSLESSSENTSSTTKSEATFDQLIDLGNISNEDAVNSNPAPHPPIIAFEDNLNPKIHQEPSNNTPDLLL